MDACESFVGNPVWPEGCFCDENIIGFSQGATIANLEPNRLPNGVQNEAWETLLVSRGRLGGRGGGHKEIRKAVGNGAGTRPDFRSGAARPGWDVTRAGGGGQALGFSNIQISSGVFV